MNKLSNTIIAFPNRRPLRAVKVRYAGPAKALACRTLCHWELDTLSGRPTCVWFDGEPRANTEIPDPLRVAS